MTSEWRHVVSISRKIRVRLYRRQEYSFKDITNWLSQQDGDWGGSQTASWILTGSWKVLKTRKFIEENPVLLISGSPNTLEVRSKLKCLTFFILGFVAGLYNNSYQVVVSCKTNINLIWDTSKCNDKFLVSSFKVEGFQGHKVK